MFIGMLTTTIPSVISYSLRLIRQRMRPPLHRIAANASTRHGFSNSFTSRISSNIMKSSPMQCPASISAISRNCPIEKLGNTSFSI